MMKKMRGFLDPYTLGFLLSLIGATTAYIVHQDDGEPATQTEKSSGQTNSADTDSSDDSDI